MPLRFSLFWLCFVISAEVRFDLYSESPRGCWSRHGVRAGGDRSEASLRLTLRSLPPHDTIWVRSEISFTGGRREQMDWIIPHSQSKLELRWPEVEVVNLRVEAVASRRAIEIQQRAAPGGAVIFGKNAHNGLAAAL